jgi:hypothetical protein
MVKKKKDEDLTEAPPAPDESTQTQAQRDEPFQRRLSAILQAETDARDGQIARSQERQASTKRQQENTTEEQNAP